MARVFLIINPSRLSYDIGYYSPHTFFVSECEFVPGGPEGRHEIATSVRAWSGRCAKFSEARRADTSPRLVTLLYRAFGAYFIFDWFSIHDLTVAAISSRPFGP